MRFIEFSKMCDIKLTCGSYVCIWCAVWSELAKESFLYVESVDSAVILPDLDFVEFGLENAICCLIEFSKMYDIKVISGL